MIVCLLEILTLNLLPVRQLLFLHCQPPLAFETLRQVLPWWLPLFFQITKAVSEEVSEYSYGGIAKGIEDDFGVEERKYQNLYKLCNQL